MISPLQADVQRDDHINKSLVALNEENPTELPLEAWKQLMEEDEDD